MATRREPGLAGLLTFYNRGQDRISSKLRDTLQTAGRALGINLGVTSGYRSPAYNRRVGGARSSLHMFGKAADIDLKGLDKDERTQLVQALSALGARGFISYSRSPDMLHVDMRSRDTPHFMHDRSARNFGRAPDWMKDAKRTADVSPEAFQRWSMEATAGPPVPTPRGVSRAEFASMAPPTAPLSPDPVSRGTMGGIEGQLAPAPEYATAQAATPQRMTGGFEPAPAGTPQISPALSNKGLAAAYQGLGQSLAQAGVRDLAGTTLTGGPTMMPAAPAPPVLDVQTAPLEPVAAAPPPPPLAPPVEVDTIRTMSLPPAPVPMRADPVMRSVQPPQLGLMGRIATSPMLGGVIGNAMKETYYPPAPPPLAPVGNLGPLGLTSYGQQAANISDQFANALSRGGVGLY